MAESSDNQSRVVIELEDCPASQSNDSASPPYASPIADEYHPEIPNDRPHYCPTCDYDVRGLTNRICPECGNSFSVVTARQRARDKAHLPTGDRNAIRLRKFYFYSGIAMLFAFILSPLSLNFAAWRAWLFVMGAMGVFSGWIVAMIKESLGRTWPEAIFLTGITLIGISGFISLFFLLT